jgi:adenine phosphoribosyltransferase
MNNGELFESTIYDLEDKIVEKFDYDEVDVIVGIESRGFIFGAALAALMGIRFVPARKAGKLPGETEKFEYGLEYGTDTLEIHKDAIKPGQRVAIVDDLLATGGTMEAAAKLIEKIGGEVVSMQFLIELEELKGKDKLSNYHINSLIKY